VTFSELSSPISGEESAIPVANLVSGDGNPLSPADVIGHVLIVITPDGPRVSVRNLDDLQQIAVMTTYASVLAGQLLAGLLIEDSEPTEDEP